MKIKPDEVTFTLDAEAGREQGKKARETAPPASFAEFTAAARTDTALSRILAQEPDRVEDLLPLRHTRMAGSPWAYLRGAAAVMAADLVTLPGSGLDVQLCGDAHILNFGLWASPERDLLFDPRDFDETIVGPFEWDLMRLATSVHVLASDLGVPEETANKAVSRALKRYAEAMTHYATMGELDVWYDKLPVRDALGALDKSSAKALHKQLKKQSHKRSGDEAVRKYTVVEDGRRRITLDPPKRLPLPATGSSLSSDVVTQIGETYADSLPFHQRRLLLRFRRADAVQQVVGVGSVGMRIALVLFESRTGRQPVLLQMKQAVPSVYEQYLGASPLENHGERVVVGQRLMQSASDIFLGWTRVNGNDFYVRQFRDMKIIPDGPTVAPVLVQFAGSCGRALAKSHARSGNPDAISAYLGKGGKGGKGTAFCDGVGEFARRYAKQTVTDHAELVEAIESGAIPGTAPD